MQGCRPGPRMSSDLRIANAARADWPEATLLDQLTNDHLIRHFIAAAQSHPLRLQVARAGILRSGKLARTI
jgi:hypothetical protein